jgi:hypothetical protein
MANRLACPQLYRRTGLLVLMELSLCKAVDANFFKQLNEIKFLWRNNSARVIVHPTLPTLLEQKSLIILIGEHSSKPVSNCLETGC